MSAVSINARPAQPIKPAILSIDLVKLPVGSLLRLGASVIGRVTQIGKKCHVHCQIFHTVGDCIMPREGIFIEILQGGTVTENDAIEVDCGAREPKS